jgi:16S rRNA (cytidine1402-2'-O)-methyltransferase
MDTPPINSLISESESGSETDAAGVLFVVATPIGTLADLSPRARDLLASVDFVACEDTRHTLRLLQAHGIQAPLESLHGHNEYARARPLVERLLEGRTRRAALVTDAGTPGVSDPGSHFVDVAHSRGVRVLSVPGPSSLASALGACGFESRRVVFSTFFPRDGKNREKELAVWRAAAPCVGVCFESPQRVVELLAWFEKTLPEGARVCVSREISKRFEEHIRGTPQVVSDVLSRRKAQGDIRGEFVVTVELPERASLLAEGLRLGDDGVARPEATLEELALLVLSDVATTGDPLKKAVKARAEGTRYAAKDLYALVQAKKDEREIP